jgi:cytochrome c-type biogenesis protein CcmH
VTSAAHLGTAARRVALLATLVLTLAAPAAATAAPRASLPDIEDEVMCPICGVPLNLATDAPQANRERAFIRSLIDQGESKEEIKRRLAQEFGPNVLALPERKGFSLTAYLVPVAGLLAALIGLAVLLPRWRRQTRGDGDQPAANVGPELSCADARRLDDDLARYDV